jgi:release factor glutamine methyltransferase
MPTTVSAALQHATARGLERLDAQWLLLHALRPALTLSDPWPDRSWLVAHGDEALPPSIQANFEACVARRLLGEPLAYIIGWHEFHGLRLRLTRDVLVPRPDTETLVDWAIACARDLDAVETPWALDLGTGSGAVALAFQRFMTHWRVTATDTSTAALAVAQRNAEAHGLAVEFIRANWFEFINYDENKIKIATKSISINNDELLGKYHKFHIIISNPPYIAAQDAHLPALRYEPPQALTSGPDGLNDIRHIVQTAPGHLHPGGWLLLEHGHDQADRVCALLRAHGFTEVQSRRDLGGHRRCSGGKMPA